MRRHNLEGGLRAPFTPEWVEVRRKPMQVREPVGAIRSPADVAALMRPLAEVEEQECVWILCLNSMNEPRTVGLLTRGTLNGSLVHARDVFRYAIACNAAGIILAHNHPSGNPQPSEDDKAITRLIANAGVFLDLPLYDHVIVGADSYFSFAEAGQMFGDSASTAAQFQALMTAANRKIKAGEQL